MLVKESISKTVWASSWDYGTYHTGYQRRLRRACSSAQSCLSLHCSHTWSMEVDKGSNQTFNPMSRNLWTIYLPLPPNIYHNTDICYIWTASSEFGTYRLCEQRRFRRACASAQSRQNLRCSLIQAVSQEEPSDRKPDPWPLRMAGHAQLKFVMTECSKTQIRLTRLIWGWNYKKWTEPRHEKTRLREFPTRSDSNWPAQLQKLAWGLKFLLQKLEKLHYLGSEQQRRRSACADAQADLRLCCSHMT